MKWNPKNKKRFESLGYKYTYMGDSFIVDVKDLSKGSNVEVVVQCDYCGKVFTKYYITYNSACKGFVNKDSCDECKRLKIRDTLITKYGVGTPDKVEGAAEKHKATNLERYGVENVFANDEVKKKIAKTNLEKYGDTCPNRCESVQAKRAATCMARYGDTSHMKTEKYKDMFRGSNNSRWKPDKSLEDRERDRSCTQYREWRFSVYARDNFICRRCGSRGGKRGLEAHHIKNWASNKDLRYDVNNGITLCYNCHKEFHKRYGKCDNSQEQIDEFLSTWQKDMLNYQELKLIEPPDKKLMG